MAASGSSNGNGAWWRALVSPPFLLTLALLLVGGAAAWTRVDSHTQDCNVHHTMQQLDDSYVRRDVHDEQIAALRRQVDRIEAKLDRALVDDSAGR